MKKCLRVFKCKIATYIKVKFCVSWFGRILFIGQSCFFGAFCYVKYSHNFMRNLNRLTICRCFYENQLLKLLFEASNTYLKREQWELPIGLIARLILGDPAFVDQFASTVDQKHVSFDKILLN